MSSTSSIQNKVGLSQEKINLLQKLLRKLEDFGGELQNRVLRYVLDGEGESVLADLEGAKDAAHALGLRCSQEYGFGPTGTSWSEFLAAIEPVDCRFYLRLGKVFEATAKKLPAARFICEFWFDNAMWLEILLQEGTRTSARTWSSEQRKTAITGPLIEAMLTADGRSSQAFVVAPFRAETKRWENGQMREMVLRVSDLGTTYAAHRDWIAPFLKEGSAASRLIAVQNLAQAGASAEVFLEELVLCATDSSKLLREAAEAMLRQVPQAAQAPLARVAKEGSRSEREAAVRLLGRICGESAREFLTELRTTEKSEPIVREIDTALGNLKAATQAAPDFVLQPPPPHTPLPLTPPVTPALRACLERAFAEYNEQATQHNNQLAAPSSQPRYVYPNTKLPSLSPVDLERACRMLEQGGALRGIFSNSLAYAHALGNDPKGGFRAFLEHPDCQLIHAVRLLGMVNEISSPNEHNSGMNYRTISHLELFRQAHQPRCTLRDLADAIRSLRLPDDIIVRECLASYYHSFDWEPEAVWPFFYDRLDFLMKALEAPSSRDWSVKWRWQREFENALRILAKFPQVPPALIGKLWELAIGTSKSDRERAQKVAAKLPDLQDRLAQALTSGSFQTRAVAAEWLGRLGDQRAVGPLDAAARKEKQDLALDEILTALERLGQPIEPYLDREKLQVDAAKGLKKGPPDALAWFPWSGLPKVHWQDTGEEIPAEVITWLLVQNYKLKSAEAGPLLRRYCSLMRPAEREELGRFVLAAWLDQDLKRKHTDTEARTLAKQQAAQAWQANQGYVQWYQQRQQAAPSYLQQSPQQLEESMFQALQRECGSAAGEKGVLAVAGACGGPAIVPPVQRYLKDWYGYRAAQCKALIAMLSAVDSPSAIQYLLSISNRFRTKGIREEAEKYVALLAERKGWTLDELADRTMPTAGFDDEGQLELSFGPRKFIARVNADLEAVVYDEEGKALKALPAPRKEDDEEQAKAAKKALSAAKAELKRFSGMQTTRLYEAMCTERTWPVADWRMYLLAHPLLRFLCQRLVWSVREGDAVRQTFRPLDDGTLTDFEDGTVTLASDATIGIAHGCQVLPEVAAAWTRHLADYDVSPLFTQFGRETYILPEEKRRETALADFEGHMLEAFKLRSLATKLGYTRGQAQDGGWFYDYHKSFPGLGLEVELTFSGNGLPEENRIVALGTLAFQKSAQQETPFMPKGGIPLDKVPAVLLTECYCDLRSIAAAGSGFDPEWQKKVY